MAERDPSKLGVNPGYASFQLAKAIAASHEHADASVRERAAAKVAKWSAVLRELLSGNLQIGSRTPVKAPAWATLEVVTGGFATGALLAGGALQDHEQELLVKWPGDHKQDARRLLNAYYLTEEGLAELQARVESGCYEINVPEEGALLVVAWLVRHGHAEGARALLDELFPYFDRLRFYPIPSEQPRRFGSLVHVQDVKSTLDDIERIQPNPRILSQKEAVEIWAPFYDRIVALWLETYAGDWPCRAFPNDWSARAAAIGDEYAKLRNQHRRCRKLDRPREHAAQLRLLLAKAARNAAELTGRDVGVIRMIIQRYLAKRGRPDSETCVTARQQQRADVAGPTFHEIAAVVSARLRLHVRADGLDDASEVLRAVGENESRGVRMPVGSAVPETIRRKVERCLNQTVSELVANGLITSGEALARVLPQMTSGLRAAGISDPQLRQLYAAIYQAFRRRRSLLLLNLEKQVQIEELPWIAALDRFRQEGLSSRQAASEALREISLLTVRSFPYAILPNKLLQELRALAKSAALDLPLVEEVAADIFMGQFSNKFVEAVHRAAALLRGSLYAAYFDVDFEAVARLPLPPQPESKRIFRQLPPSNPLAALCAARSGVSIGTWRPATNGMIIEQQQILTTQNLAVLFGDLQLRDALSAELSTMAMESFHWVCQRLQMKTEKSHAKLIMVKNCAYAWRQMIFYLALMPRDEVLSFLDSARGHLARQRPGFVARFRPALRGLELAAQGHPLDRDPTAQRFLGWSDKKHWLL
jgi:hypothetical protein